MSRADTLEALLVAAHRLTRLAASDTGSRTPSAVWRTLSILETEGPLRVGELAAASRITQPGVTRLLGGMLHDGLVARRSDDTDSRVALIEITEPGRRALANWRRTLSETLEPRFRTLDSEDWETLERAVEIIAQRTRPAVAA